MQQSPTGDPSWVPTGNLGTARAYHTATLLPNGKVLVAGGEDNGGNGLSSTELYDPGLGFDPGWQPLLTMVTPLIVQGTELTAPAHASKASPKLPAATVRRTLRPTIRWSNC